MCSESLQFGLESNSQKESTCYDLEDIEIAVVVKNINGISEVYIYICIVMSIFRIHFQCNVPRVHKAA